MRFVIFLFAQFNAETLCSPVLDACAYSFQYSKHRHTAQGRSTTSGVPAFSDRLFGKRKPRKLLQLQATLPKCAVDLRAFEAARTVVDEALHVLRRIAEKQPYLMGELFVFAEAAGKPRHTALTALIAIARLPQQLGRLHIPQIPPQSGGAIEVKERLPRQKAPRR